MSVSKWCYNPDYCDGDFCVGDCDLCPKTDEIPDVLVSRNDLIDKLEETEWHSVYKDGHLDHGAANQDEAYIHYMDANDIIKGSAPVDAVEICRCLDCVHRPTDSGYDEIGGFKYEFPDDRCPCRAEVRYYSWMPSDDWFCANGERHES